MAVRAIWTGLIRFASMLEVVIEKAHGSDRGSAGKRIASTTCLDCAVLQLPQEGAGTLHLEQLLIAPQFHGSSEALEMVAISGRMRSQRLGRWARLSSCLSLSFADALSAKTASVGRPFACVVSSTSVLPPDFRPLPHAGRQRYVWHKWLQN
jgi:hypothetical protein